MRKLAVAVVLILTGCTNSSKKEVDLTFFKWNIHESYYLKFNSSDTLYYIDVYGFKEETFFTILNRDEKERIHNILNTITFPKNHVYESQVDDGETNAFVLKDENQTRKLKIHGHNGPNRFWLFAKSLDNIKSVHKFTKTDKKIDLEEMNKMVIMKLPSNFVVDTLQ
ncbi:hypothetical protein [Flavobacterium reichenbachii]|uniref:Lipoprotein n=1 Tax=Flavobacterium reichenbachii TaxID=362418 RepID=A0A085ZKP7_9FLAO|nr:hypothetical protein [Flavobacterium reichenbachii]KFF05011.1 hypothetical protein IW19_05475 [Flavobacterium reichenbachii]OXB16315.1 hypothetical protein B0A68_08660 [Flavobacterium reichenbachii]